MQVQLGSSEAYRDLAWAAWAVGLWCSIIGGCLMVGATRALQDKFPRKETIVAAVCAGLVLAGVLCLIRLGDLAPVPIF
jgi:hypothetical protein